MKTPLPARLTRENLFLWLMHRITEEYRDKAILKGGMELRLLDCPRMTNDLDYVFVPFRSKKEIASGLGKILKDLQTARITTNVHSTSLRIGIRIGEIAVQIEANVALTCLSQVLTTQALARQTDIKPIPIRAMRLDVALSHKLAAWNERRLSRDLYDIYFLSRVQGQVPEWATLRGRLRKARPQAKRKSRKNPATSIPELASELEAEADALTEARLDQELGDILSPDELAGLHLRIKTALHALSAKLESADR